MKRKLLVVVDVGDVGSKECGTCPYRIERVGRQQVVRETCMNPAWPPTHIPNGIRHSKCRNSQDLVRIIDTEKYEAINTLALGAARHALLKRGYYAREVIHALEVMYLFLKEQTCKYVLRDIAEAKNRLKTIGSPSDDVAWLDLAELLDSDH